MPPRKRRDRDSHDTHRKRLRRDDKEEDRVVISDSEEEDDFRPSSSSALRAERRRERETKTRSNDMTEEEMLDLAMKLSEQEASKATLRQRQEEEAVRKAIAESLYADSTALEPDSESLLVTISPTQPRQTPQGQSSQTDVDTTALPSRRKLAYPNPGVGVAGSEGPPEGSTGVGGALIDGDKRRRKNRKEGSPLPEMPDLSQTQKVYSQPSPFSSASVSASTSPPPSASVPLLSLQEDGSPSQRNPIGDLSTNKESQDCNSTQSDSQLGKSPVFPRTPSSASRLVVRVRKLSQELLEDCQTSGLFVAMSQGGPPGLTSPHRSQSSPQLKSPTFPQSPVISSTDTQEEETQRSPDREENDQRRSPTFPKSPVFPRTDQSGDSAERAPAAGANEAGDEDENTWEGLNPKSLVLKSRDASQCLTRTRAGLSLRKRPMAAEDPPGDVDSVGNGRPSSDNVDQEEHEDESSRNAARYKIGKPATSGLVDEQPNSKETQELTSNMVLRWSADEDDDPGTTQQTQSPSPVFPQEGPLPQPGNQGAPLNPVHISPPHSPGPGPQKRTHPLEESGCEGESKAKRVRRKFTYKGMSGALSPSGSHEGAPGRGLSPLQTQDPFARLSPPTEGQGEGGKVMYYWGVPFCPRGQNPDTYTQVILSQLEVYEKSLKEAQRGLLRKAVWGEPVLPGPPKRSYSGGGRLRRHRAPRLLEEEEEEQEERRGKEEEEEEEEEEVVEVVDDEEEEGEMKKKGMEKTGRRRRGGREWIDCDALLLSSPERNAKSPSPIFDAERIIPRRKLGLRREKKRPAETQTQPPQRREEEEEEEEERDRGEEKSHEKEGEKWNEEEEEERMGEEEELDVGGCDVCPETQMSNDSSQDLMVTSPAQPSSQSLPQIQSFLPGQAQAQTQPGDQREEGMEVDGEEGSGPAGGGEDVKMEEEEEVVLVQQQQQQQRTIPLPAPPPRSPSPSMECPMCMRPYPLSQIEMHAAYCDGMGGGTEEEQEEERPQERPQEKHSQVPVKARRKRTRKGELIGENQPSSSGSGKAEKCFLCQKVFPLREYERHVEDCIQRQSSKSSEAGPSGTFLAALDQTEARESGNAEAGPCDTTTFRNSQSGFIDHVDAVESGGSGDFSAPGFGVSASPIRSFTPISEATDCLVDFKRQYSAKPSQRAGRKRRYKR